ncbi:hypothetical protein [Rhizobium laguerreae]|uniref:hypothetical protein n=1 Tax=Rhizobium laguerreae TaxID=1076926 RepID=UPI001C9123C3|nr:hypothetical protein [Rhizobium laguerreae]
MELDPSDEKMEGGPDLAAIAARTPRRQGQKNAVWADALKAANPDLSAKDAARIVGATQSNIARRAAFQAVSAEEQERLDVIAAATPRRQRQKNAIWADALKAANPDLSAKDAAKIVGATQGHIAKRGAFQAVSAEEQMRLDAIATATPRQGQKNAAWADALKAANPDLSAKDAARIVGAAQGDIASRAAFQALSAEEQMRLDEIAARTPRRQGQKNGAWADALKTANPDLSAKDAARIVGATQIEIAMRAAFQAVSAEEQERLDAIARATPRQGQKNGAWADALKVANPDLSAKDAAKIVGATQTEIATRAAFQAVTAEEQERLDAIATATPRQRRSKGAWADALKAANPDLSAKDAAKIVGASHTEIAIRAAFQAVTADHQMRLDVIAARTPRRRWQKNGAWADALKTANPDLSAKDAARIVGATQTEIAMRAAFQAVTAEEQERLDVIATATPRQRRSKGAWADALKAANPDLSAEDTAIIVGATRHHIADRAAFQALSAEEQERLDEIAARTPRRQGQKNAAWADALKAANPDLSANDAAKIVGATQGDIARRGAFQAVSAEEQMRLDEIAARTPRQRQSKVAWADALKAANPDLSAKDAAIIVGATQSNIAERATFQAVSAEEQMRLDEIAARTPRRQGQKNAVWADALKAANSNLSAKDAAKIVGATHNEIARRAAFQALSAEEQMRLDAIATATPRQGRNNAAWTDALKRANPDLSAKDAAKIVGATQTEIAMRAAFQAVSAEEQERLDAIATATPRQRRNKGAWADALKAANPDLSAKDAAIIVGATQSNIAMRAAFQALTADHQMRLDEIAARTPRRQGQKNAAWADALKRANPDLSVKDAARIIGATQDVIARRAAFQAVSAEEQERLDAIARATPRQGQKNAAWADALKAANPDLSAKDAARIVGATHTEIADRATFQAVTAEEQMRLDEIAARTPRRQGQNNAAWADALKRANPDLSAKDAAIIVGATQSNIAMRAAFQALTADHQMRLDAIAARTPRRRWQKNAAWADALKRANPDLSAKDAARIVGATQTEIAMRAAFQAVTAEEQMRLDEIAARTPRRQGQNNAAWTDALKAANPDLSAKDTAIIVGATQSDIATRGAFQAVTADHQMRLDAIAARTPRRQGQKNGAWADALKAANPDLSAKDAAKIVGATQGHIARRAAFQALSAEEQMRLDEIAARTPRRRWQKNGAWADALKVANPDLSAKDAARIVGAAHTEIARRAAFQAVSAEEQMRLDEIAARTPRRQRQSKVAWADALKAANPDLSAKDAAKIVGATQRHIASRAAFQALSAEEQERLDEIAARTPRRQGQKNAVWADALKAANPDLSAKDAAKIVGATQGDIARRGAFQAVSAEEQMRLDEIAARTPRRQGQKNAAWADALKRANPDLSAKDAAKIVGATQTEIAMRAAFQAVTAEEQERLDEIAARTPRRQGQNNAAWADALKRANPDLSAKDAARIVGAAQGDIASRAVFQALSAEEQMRLDEIAARTPRRQGQKNAVWADALKAANPDLSAKDAARIVGAAQGDIASRAAFQALSAEEQMRLDEIAARTPRRQGQKNAVWADALKAANSDLSAKDAAKIVGATHTEIAMRAAFQAVTADHQMRLDVIAARTPRRQGQKNAAWADALKAANPDLSAKDAAKIVGATQSHIAERVAFQAVSAEEQERLDVIATATPRQRRSKGAWADALKAANPDLSTNDAARIVGATQGNIARRAAFQAVSAQDQEGLAAKAL